MSQRPPGRDRSDDDEFARVAADLTRELRELRSELEREHRRRPRDPPRGPLGLPRPPTPREILEFADEVAIPALIAVLEANIKLLEGLQAVLRLADTGREARERTTETGRSVGRTASRAGEAASGAGEFAFDRLNDALGDLQEAIEGGGLPEGTDAEGEDIIADIRDLRSEIDDRIREAGRPYDRPRSRENRRTRSDHRDRDEDGTDAGLANAAGPRGREYREKHDIDDPDGEGERRGDEEGRLDGDRGNGADRRDGESTQSRGRDRRSEGRRDRSDPEDGSDRNDDSVEIDVEAELDSLRERYREDDDEEDGDDA